jgi:hypothetical protein
MSQPTTTTTPAQIADAIAATHWTAYAVIGARVVAGWPVSVLRSAEGRDAAHEAVGMVWEWLVLVAAAELVGGATKEETVSDYEIAYNPDTTEFDLTFRGEKVGNGHRNISDAERARVEHAAARLAPQAIEDQGGRRYTLVEQRPDGSAVYRAPRARAPLYLSDYAVRLMAEGMGVTIEELVDPRSGRTRLFSYRAA